MFNGPEALAVGRRQVPPLPVHPQAGRARDHARIDLIGAKGPTSVETSLNEIVGLTLIVLGLVLFGVSLAGMLGFVPPPPWGRDAGPTHGDHS